MTQHSKAFQKSPKVLWKQFSSKNRQRCSQGRTQMTQNEGSYPKKKGAQKPLFLQYKSHQRIISKIFPLLKITNLKSDSEHTTYL